MDGLTDDERDTLKNSIDDLSSDSPRTELAAHRFKRILGKVSRSAAPVLRSIVIDVASEATKKLLQ